LIYVLNDMKGMINCVSCHFLLGSDNEHPQCQCFMPFRRHNWHELCQNPDFVSISPSQSHEHPQKLYFISRDRFQVFTTSHTNRNPHWNHYDFSGDPHYISLSARILLLSMLQVPADEFLQPLHLSASLPYSSK